MTYNLLYFVDFNIKMCSLKDFLCNFAPIN